MGQVKGQVYRVYTIEEVFQADLDTIEFEVH